MSNASFPPFLAALSSSKLLAFVRTLSSGADPCAVFSWAAWMAVSKILFFLCSSQPRIPTTMHMLVARRPGRPNQDTRTTYEVRGISQIGDPS
jgi:hypothetical protein